MTLFCKCRQTAWSRKSDSIPHHPDLSRWSQPPSHGSSLSSLRILCGGAPWTRRSPAVCWCPWPDRGRWSHSSFPDRMHRTCRWSSGSSSRRYRISPHSRTGRPLTSLRHISIPWGCLSPFQWRCCRCSWYCLCWSRGISLWQLSWKRHPSWVCIVHPSQVRYWISPQATPRWMSYLNRDSRRAAPRT